MDRIRIRIDDVTGGDGFRERLYGPTSDVRGEARFDVDANRRTDQDAWVRFCLVHDCTFLKE